MTNRKLNFLGFCFAFSILVASLLLQYFADLSPCPLCIWQRVILSHIVLLLLLGAILPLKKIGLKIIAGFSALFSVAGSVLASYQLYLQHNPKQSVGGCSPSLEYLLQDNNFYNAIVDFLKSPGSCEQIDYSIFGLSLAFYSSLVFCLLAILCFYSLFRKGI